MKHTLQISVSKNQAGYGVVSSHRLVVRERLLRFLFGAKQRLTIIVPGDSVEALSIRESDVKGETGHEQNQVVS